MRGSRWVSTAPHHLITPLESLGDEHWQRLAPVLDHAAVYVDIDDRFDVSLPDRVAYMPAVAPTHVFVVGGRGVLIAEVAEIEVVKPCALEAAGAVGVQLGAAHWATVDAAAQERMLSRIWCHGSACMLGVARAAYEHALRYTQEREAFGRVIAHHQSIAFLLAELRVALDASRLLLHRAALCGDHVAAAQAFIECAEAALKISDAGVQLLGGHGYVKDHPVEKYYREARTLSLLYGGRDGAQVMSA